MRKKVLPILIGVLLTFSAVSAQALPYQSEDGFLTAGDYHILSFSQPANPLASALLTLNISSVTNVVKVIAGKTFTSPPSAEIFFDPTANYLFSTDLKVGQNLFDMNNYLAQLNSSTGGIYLGLFMDRGGITLNSATLSGTMAPEPGSMALVGAGLVILPFARRFRKTISS